VRATSLDRASPGESELLERLGLAERAGVLTDDGRTFDDSWWVYGDQEIGKALFRDALMAQPETQVVVQALHGRGPISVEGVVHLLSRHGIADPDDPSAVRRFLETLNRAEIVAYSNRNQTVRVTVPVPDEGGPAPSVRVVQPERPYSNVRHLREVLRACRDFIWWTEPHFVPKLLEPLVDEADAERISEIRILTGEPKDEGLAEKGKSDFKRFRREMQTLGITAEWRVVEGRPEQHDRFLLERSRSWNMPPINTLLKGDYSEISETPERPPFEEWWAAAKSLI